MAMRALNIAIRVVVCRVVRGLLPKLSDALNIIVPQNLESQVIKISSSNKRYESLREDYAKIISSAVTL
jgi:hypothetical protein